MIHSEISSRATRLSGRFDDPIGTEAPRSPVLAAWIRPTQHFGVAYHGDQVATN